jgi:membrane fusion protein (multidrug efflux system)
VAGRLGEVAVLPVGAYVTVGSRLCSIVPEAPVRVVAEFPWSSALGRIEPGQSAQVRLTGFSWVEWGALRGSVLSVATEAPAGAVRVELALADDQVSRAPMEHGLAAEVLVEVERVAPVVLLARAVGKALSPAPAARPPSDGLAGRPP